MKITVNEKEINVTSISISAKCSDLCYAQLKNLQGNVLAKHDGYVPDLMPEEHYGDYIILDIDLETGTILNWKRPSIKIVEKTEWELE